MCESRGNPDEALPIWEVTLGMDGEVGRHCVNCGWCEVSEHGEVTFTRSQVKIPSGTHAQVKKANRFGLAFLV